MKITVINKRATGGMPVTCVDSTQCKPGETHEMLGRSQNDYIAQMGLSSGNEIIVRAELDAMDYPPFVNVMKTPADPAGGVYDLAGCGFDLKELDLATDANKQPQMWMGIYSDAACTVPSITAHLDTATKGTINSGSGTSLIKVTPDATGEFACTCSDTAARVLYLKAWPVASDYEIDSSRKHTLTLTAP